jgi:hypothetical protein
MTAADFRAELAKRRVHRYQAAAAVRLNPQRFSLMLNEHIPLPADLASRLQTYLRRFDEEHGQHVAGVK